MNLQECQDLINQYVKWLKEGLKIQKINDVYEITTPFLDRHNDLLQIYIEPGNSDNSFYLTDYSYTINDLRLSGMEFNTPRRKNLLNTIINGFGVRLKGEELFVESNKKNFPRMKHNLLQAMLSVDDLFALASPSIAQFFLEDVETFFLEKNIRYIKDVKFAGKSGYDQKFNFVIPASAKKPERILSAINKPDKQKIFLLDFGWSDVRETRSKDTRCYAVLNDEERISAELLRASKSYGVIPAPWSQREKFVEEWAG
ncbi:MAG: DUF1828 domain-containing protein [Candidatus Eremiobacteraeota bacterium]|nr:DUF1828 domain-containing protein [Candidatus Eremiobacteraeota bacterium]